MKKILVPVDFSDHTNITCGYAMEFARAYASELLLFHTYFDQVILTDTTFPDSMNINAVYDEELIREIQKLSEKNMEELHARILDQASREGMGNIRISTRVVGGDIEMELRMVCNDFQPSMVVMGTRGQGRNVNIWGRVSTHIINHAKVPVLTVPELSAVKGFQAVMFAADLSESNAAAIHKVLRTMKPFGSRILVVHFLTGKEGEAEKMEALRQSFTGETASGLIRFDLVKVEEDNQKALDEFVQNLGVSVIAFQPHKRSVFYNLFTRNLTKKNLFSTHIPLLAIPVD